jgi:transposase-like protein
MARFSETTTYEITCPACECDRVVKIGFQSGTQRYRCKSCRKDFRANGKATGRRMDSEVIGAAIRYFCSGMSYKQIAEAMTDRHDIPEPSKATIYEWVRDFTDEAVKEMANHKAETSGHWVADEMYIDVGGQKVYHWNVMYKGTRYILASYLSKNRDGNAARAVLRRALAAADKPPKTITTDKWRAYLKPIRDLMPDSKHIQSEGLASEINNNLSERLQGTYRDRIKTLRGLDYIGSGQRYLDGWSITYNLFWGHHSLGNDRPAQRAKVNPPFTEWADVVKGDAASPKLVELEARRTSRVKLPEIRPPRCGVKMAKGASSPIPPSALATLPRALRPKPPKAQRLSRAA